MTNAQGTVWETEILDRGLRHGMMGMRYPKRAQKHEPDLYIHPVRAEGMRPERHIGVVMWKRLVGKKDGQPRKPDGERRVVIMALDDFFDLVESSRLDYYVEVQAKWTQALNVTRVLGGLRSWMKGHPTWPSL